MPETVVLDLGGIIRTMSDCFEHVADALTHAWPNLAVCGQGTDVLYWLDGPTERPVILQLQQCGVPVRVEDGEVWVEYGSAAGAGDQSARERQGTQITLKRRIRVSSAVVAAVQMAATENVATGQFNAALERHLLDELPTVGRIANSAQEEIAATLLHDRLPVQGHADLPSAQLLRLIGTAVADLGGPAHLLRAAELLLGGRKP
jgi:hypothetical protein